MKKTNKVNLAIFSAGLMTFTGILNETSMNVTYPLLVKQFHQSLAAVQWITTAYLLTVTIVMGATAYLLKRFSARWLHLAAGSAFIYGNNLAWILLLAGVILFPSSFLSTKAETIICSTYQSSKKKLSAWFFGWSHCLSLGPKKFPRGEIRLYLVQPLSLDRPAGNLAELSAPTAKEAVNSFL